MSSYPLSATKTPSAKTILKLAPEAIALLPVCSALSAAPIDLLLASQAARRAIQTALPCLDASTTLELNASSGTPAMKAAWSIMQAAGYAPHSRIWQVRNPKEARPGQDRVFANSVNILKQEFDLKSTHQCPIDGMSGIDVCGCLPSNFHPLAGSLQ